VSFLRETRIPRAEGSLKVKKIVNFEGSLDIPSVVWRASKDCFDERPLDIKAILKRWLRLLSKG
jgi:hypothetical protein